MAGNTSWTQQYYARYVAEAERLGVTPAYGYDQFASKLNEKDYEGSYSTVYKTDLVAKATAKINELKKQSYDWGADASYTPYSGATSIDELSTALANQISTTNTTKPKNIRADGTVDETLDASGKKKYVFTPSELMTQEEARLTTEAEAPDATRPEYKYSGENTAAYYDSISKSEQAGTDKAVNAVNETANYVNPYATGSGSQIKAVAGMLDNITANQQARAFALGQNAYDKEYSGKYADYEKTQAKKTAARSGLLNLSQYYTQMANEADNKNEANYWKTLGLQNDANLATLESQAEDKKYQRDTELLAKSAELNSQTNSNDWWQPFVSAGVSAITGGLGTAAVNAVTGNTTDNYFKTMQKYGISK
jgi:hypothetical protein